MPRTDPPRRAPRRLTVVAGALAIVAAGACGDDPFAIRWQAEPDTVQLYALARPELNLSSGFNFLDRRAIRVESATATGSWDVAVDRRGGEIVLLPPGALGVQSRAGIAVVEGRSFAEVTEAPEDSARYVTEQAVPTRVGTVMVVRTNQRVGAFGTRCVYYAKLEPLAIDVAAGSLTFVYDRSPVCNDRRLIPPD